MIKYALVCNNGHDFDSWFATGDAYDRQAESGLIRCAICQSAEVTKAIMAPALAHRAGEPAGEISAPPAMPEPPALLDSRQMEIRAMLSAMRSEIMTTAVDVGSRFSDEARKMHEGEQPQQFIRGQATVAEAKALLEDGIGIMPIPPAPEDLN
jgi:hypothetical protein